MDKYAQRHNMKTKWMPWIVCIAASFFLFYEFIQGNMFATIADDIMRDFNIRADKMTYLSSVYYLSNVLFLFVAGMLLDRFSAKKTILIAMLLCVLSTFVLAQAHSFYLAMVCRFVTGIGSAFCFLGPVRIASRWFPAKKMAFVTGVIVTIAMTGGMLAQYPLTKLVVYIGWRHSLFVIGWLGIFVFLMMIFLVKDKVEHQRVEHTIKRMNILTTARMAYLNPQTLRAACYASLMNMSVAVFGAVMGTLYVMQRLGVDRENAAMVNSVLFLGAIVGGPVMGWCSDKSGLRLLPMRIGLLASLITLLAILYLPVSLFGMGCLFFLLGLFTSSQVISYALVAESTPLAITATAVSMVSIMTQGGYILYQNLFSFLLTHHGEMQLVNQIPVYSLADYQSATVLLPAGLGLALLAIWGLKETYCRHIQE